MATYSPARSHSVPATPGLRPNGNGGVAFILDRDRASDTNGTAATFDQARADFEAAWRVFLANRKDPDFQAGRDQQAWTAEKYRRFDWGERMSAASGQRETLLSPTKQRLRSCAISPTRQSETYFAQ
jgi:hypothetical protein